MKTTSPKLIQLFQQMSELTAPECATSCRIPHSCCSPEYCEYALQAAARQGVPLSRTSHPTLPLMGEAGVRCTSISPACVHAAYMCDKLARIQASGSGVDGRVLQAPRADRKGGMGG
jgi:hypothetical protein